jgi:ABC-type multidrug transport system ATPase subunit
MLLLTLAGRARPTAGRLTVAGHTARAHIRRCAAVARVTGAAELDPDLQVVDHIRETRLLTDNDEPLGIDLDPTTRIADLAIDDAVLFAVALAMTSHPRLIVVDDVDIAASPEQQRRIWDTLATLPTTVIATTVDGSIAGAAGATVVPMTGGR